MSSDSAAMPDWPPFSIKSLPIEVQRFVEDFKWAYSRPHHLSVSSIVTLIVPCYDPNPKQFAQLLQSFQQQSDQDFEAIIINDGSSQVIWDLIQTQLNQHPWIQIIHNHERLGISASLNSALARTTSPYVAFVDQDDILHPGTVELIRCQLERHPTCGLLYTDHIVFNDNNAVCQYIPKFPWNSDSLLEFNYLIHLTVVRSDLYRACGGMRSYIDGIQDWEFYLRLVPYLKGYEVVYLPLPLYAWRLSERSFASSAQPQRKLLDHAYEFLTQAHERWGTSSKPASLNAPVNHYRFLIDRGGIASAQVSPLCNVLILGEDLTGMPSTASIIDTLKSILDADIAIDHLFISLNTADNGPISGPNDLDLPDSLIRIIRPKILHGTMSDLADQIPANCSLLVIKLGARLKENADWRALPQWLEVNQRWDMVTLPSFNEKNNTCISAGYSSVLSNQGVYFPHAQGLLRQEYNDDFASFGHTRAVDLPSPSCQLLSRRCLAATLDLLRQSELAKGSCPSAGWWALVASHHWRCCCPAELSVELPPSLAEAEHARVALRSSEGMVLCNVAPWLGSNANSWMLDYGSLIEHVLSHGAGRAHPLHTHSFLANSQHPAVLSSMRQKSSRFSLLPTPAHRPVVMLIPSVLNPKSHGHACLLGLALELRSAGLIINLLPFEPYRFFQSSYSNLPASCHQLSFITSPLEAPINSMLLAPESTPNKLLTQLRPHFKHVCWWLLAPAGVLTIFKPDIRVGDQLAAFSEFALPEQPRYLFVHPPAEPLLKRLSKCHTPLPPQNSLIALYTGKGRLRPLPRSLHRHLLRYQVVFINRAFPKTKKALLDLLARSNGLISFDPMTNLSLEAASLGVPVYLPNNPFPERCYRFFPVDLRPFITDSVGHFITKLRQNKPVRKLPPERLEHANSSSAAFLKLLTADPEPTASLPFTVTDQLLDRIEQYRHHLTKSHTIQILRDGQSVSSAFGEFYIRTLKKPYFTHLIFCHAMVFLDSCADFLVPFGIFFIVFKPFRLLWSGCKAIRAKKRRKRL